MEGVPCRAVPGRGPAGLVRHGPPRLGGPGGGRAALPGPWPGHQGRQPAGGSDRAAGAAARARARPRAGWTRPGRPEASQSPTPPTMAGPGSARSSGGPPGAETPGAAAPSPRSPLTESARTEREKKNPLTEMCSGSRARTALDPPPATTAFFSASDSSPAERAAAAATAAAAEAEAVAAAARPAP